MTRSETFTFTPQSPRQALANWLNLAELRKPENEFREASGKLIFRVAIKVSSVWGCNHSWAMHVLGCASGPPLARS